MNDDSAPTPAAAPEPALPPTLATALAALRIDRSPARPLWPGIAEAIACRRDGATAATAEGAPECAPELAPELAARLRALRTPAQAPAALWTDVSRRIAEPEARDRLTLPPVLQAQLAAQAQPVPPARDLWPAIAARSVGRQPSRRQPSGRRWRYAALAASFVVAFAALVSIERPLGGAAAVAGPATPALAPPIASVERSVAAQAAIVGFRASSTPALRQAAFRPVSPEARGLVRANLQIVRHAESEIEQALAADPDGAAYLDSLLRSARAQHTALRGALEEPR